MKLKFCRHIYDDVEHILLSTEIWTDKFSIFYTRYQLNKYAIKCRCIKCGKEKYRTYSNKTLII
jgi:hypothetical protein